VREHPRSFGIPLPQNSKISEERNVHVPAGKAQLDIVFNGAVPGDSAAYLREHHRGQAVSMILSRRLRNRLREQMAVTYTASAPIHFYRIPERRYVIVVSLLTAPEAIEKSRDAIWQEIDSLRMFGATKEELQVVTTIMRRQAENARQDNTWWFSQLESYDRLGVSYDRIVAGKPPLLSVDDVKAAAQHYLSDIYIEQTMLPTLENMKKAQQTER
jgi:predicted Zn-dependent peptidase